MVNESSVVRIRDESLADQGRVRLEVACGKVYNYNTMYVVFMIIKLFNES